MPLSTGWLPATYFRFSLGNVPLLLVSAGVQLVDSTLHIALDADEIERLYFLTVRVGTPNCLVFDVLVVHLLANEVEAKL